LFPAPYVHIGADEVPNGVWSKSPACQALMEQLGYSDYKELQGHFLRHAEDKLRKLGKRMLGWEEAQHGDKVSKDTVIYSWLSEEAALNCASLKCQPTIQYVNAFGAFKQHCGAKSSTTSLVWTTWSSRA